MAQRVSHAIKKQMKKKEKSSIKTWIHVIFTIPVITGAPSTMFPRITPGLKHYERSGGTVRLEPLLTYKYRDRSTVKPINDVEHATFFSFLWFSKFLWKHPDDSLPCLILNTFPFAFVLSKESMGETVAVLRMPWNYLGRGGKAAQSHSIYLLRPRCADLRGSPLVLHPGESLLVPISLIYALF